MCLKFDEDKTFNPSENVLEAINFLEEKRKDYNLKNNLSLNLKPTKKTKPSNTIKHINRHATLYFYLGLFFGLPFIASILIKIFGEIMVFIIFASFLYVIFKMLKYFFKTSKFLKQNKEYYIKNVTLEILKSIHPSFKKEPDNFLRMHYKTLADVIAKTNYTCTFSANINWVNISISECMLSANEGECNDSVTFCYIGELNKIQSSDTIISSISWQKVISKKGYKKIFTNNEEFDNVFTIHAKNEIKTRLFLTQNLMQTLLKINKTTKGIYFFGRNKVVFYGDFKYTGGLFYDINLTDTIYKSTKHSYERLKYVINFANLLN